jgi:protein phosphatase
VPNPGSVVAFPSSATSRLINWTQWPPLTSNEHGRAVAPNSPHGIPCLIVLVGPPGSGKTTWAERNGRGAVHVSQDGLIDAITPSGFDHAYRPVYGAAEDAAARAGLRAGHTVIVDRTNRTRLHRGRWLRIAREASCFAVAVVMTAPEWLCRERNAKRDDRSRLSAERMDRMFAAFEPVGLDEGFDSIFEVADGDEISLDTVLGEDNWSPLAEYRAGRRLTGPSAGRVLQFR